MYRPKDVMALSQLDRAMAAGGRFSWMMADEWYTQKPAFVRGLEDRGQRFVLETPRNFALWLYDPRALSETAATRVDNLWRYSHAMMRQPWQKWHVKDTDKGPTVWEVKFAPCRLPRDDGVAGPYWLIMARNALDPAEVNYFLSNAGVGVPLAIILYVAFGRWPVERVLQDIELRRNDEAFLDAVDAETIPDPTTGGDFCRRFRSEEHVRCLLDAIDEARLNVWKKQPASFFEKAVIDMDGTFAVTTSECQEGMDISYKNE